MEVSTIQLASRVALHRSLALPIRRNLFHLRPNPILLLTIPRRRGVLSTCVGSNNIDANAAVTYPDTKTSDQLAEDPSSATDVQRVAEKEDPAGSINGSIQQKKRAAKIHDFCLGIPFGGFIFGGGLVGFLFSRNIAVLSTGVLFGGAILALSTCSLKIWREGKSSLPFILGQAALAALLAVKNFQMYSFTKKLFPSGFYAVFSAAMLCFYSYVMLSGGNPPPKKFKGAASSAQS